MVLTPVTWFMMRNYKKVISEGQLRNRPSSPSSLPVLFTQAGQGQWQEEVGRLSCGEDRESWGTTIEPEILYQANKPFSLQINWFVQRNQNKQQ